MPYVPSQLIDEEKKKKALSNVNITNDNSTSFNQQSPQQNTTSTPKPVSRSGSWTNLQSYLDANKENAQEMSSKIAGNVDVKAQSATDKLNQVQTPGVVSQKTETELNNEFYSNPNAKKEDYSKLKNTGGYDGPKAIDEIENWSTINSDTNKAASLVGNTKTEDGRRVLLQDTYSRPQYSSGQKNLDNLLIQNDSTAKSKFEGLQNKWSGITDLLNNKTKEINDTIATNINNSVANKNLVPVAEKKATDSILSPINQRVQQMKQDVPALQSRLQNDIQDNVLSDETLAQLGLSEGQSLYDVNLSNYFTPNQTEISASNISSKEEKAKYKALMDLIDGVNTLDNGSADYNPYNFNKDQFSKDVAAKQAEYNNIMNTGRFTEDGSANTFGDKRISDMSYSELEAALPAMREQQRLNDENSFDAEGNPIFFNRLPVSQIEELINSINNTYKPTRKVQKG